MMLILPEHMSSADTYKHPLLKRQNICAGNAAGFLRRFARKSSERPYDENPLYTGRFSLAEVLVTGRQPKTPDPALLALPSGDVFLHFTDGTALIARSTRGHKGISVLPLILDAARQIRPRKRAPFYWCAQKCDQNSNQSISVLKSSRAGLRWTDIASRQTFDQKPGFSDEAIEGLVNTLDQEVSRWIEVFCKNLKLSPSSLFAPLVDVKSNLKQADEVDAQHWLGDLCTYLKEHFSIEGRLGLSLAGGIARQDGVDERIIITLMSGPKPADTDSKSEQIKDCVANVLSNPDSRWPLSRLVRLHTPVNGSLYLTPRSGGKVFGMSGASASRHEYINLHHKFSPLISPER
jgi:hypothetical protein